MTVRSTERIRRTALALGAALALVVAPPARAHTEVQRAVPGPGQRVDAGVSELVLVFLDPVVDGVTIEVTGPDGAPVAGLGSVVQSDDGREASVGFDPLRPGSYVVDYEFVAVDGDAQREAYRFTVVAGDDGGVPAGVIVAGVVLVAAGAVVGVALARRRKRRESPNSM